MKKPDDTDKPKEMPDGFHKREKSIRDRLDRVDEIFDNMESKKKKPEKAADTFQEICESVERGIKKFFRSASSQVKELMDEGKRSESPGPKNLAQYLSSCSDEQLIEIKNEIDRLLSARGSV